jgi:hypothetical protein
LKNDKPRDQYFASLPADKIGDALNDKIDSYYEQLTTSGHMDKINHSYRMYYGLGEYSGHQIHQRGSEGEYLQIRLNHYRSVLNHVLVLTTQHRPALQCSAINTDYDSMVASRLGSALLDYYFKQDGIERLITTAAELALITSKAYIVGGWDVNKGVEYGADPETNQVLYDGDVSMKAKSCLEVVEDLYAERPIWRIFRDLVNRYDLAAQYPELAEKIINYTPDERLPGNSILQPEDDDLVPMWTFRHIKTPAIPNGRQVEFLDPDIILTDVPLPYRGLQIHEVAHSRIAGTQLGFTPGFDLISLNRTLNDVVSTIVTSYATFGYQNIWTPPGSALTVSNLSGGLNHVESTVKPEALQLTRPPEGATNFAEFMQRQVEVLSGVNNVIRGEPQASLESGSALALVASQAIAYNSGFQQSVVSLIEDVANSVIELSKDFVQVEKAIAIVGKSSASMVVEFKGDSLSRVNRVFAEPVNPMSKTAAGRMSMADNLLNQGLIKRPEEYMRLIEEGTIKPLLESRTNQLMVIDKENELLRSGEVEVQALMTDQHGDHIRGHAQVLDDSRLRLDAELVARVLTHIQSHIELETNMNPVLGMLLRQEAPPPGSQGAPMAAPQPKGNPTKGQMPDMPAGADEMSQGAYEQMNQPTV